MDGFIAAEEEKTGWGVAVLDGCKEKATVRRFKVAPDWPELLFLDFDSSRLLCSHNATSITTE